MECAFAVIGHVAVSIRLDCAHHDRTKYLCQD